MVARLAAGRSDKGVHLPVGIRAGPLARGAAPSETAGNRVLHTLIISWTWCIVNRPGCSLGAGRAARSEGQTGRKGAEWAASQAHLGEGRGELAASRTPLCVGKPFGGLWVGKCPGNRLPICVGCVERAYLGPAEVRVPAPGVDASRGREDMPPPDAARGEGEKWRGGDWRAGARPVGPPGGGLVPSRLCVSLTGFCRLARRVLAYEGLWLHMMPTRKELHPVESLLT